MDNATTKPDQPQDDPFTAILRDVLRTPKDEIERREAEYQKEREKLPKRGPKPKE